MHSHGAVQAGVTTCSAFLDELFEDGMRDMPFDWMCSGRPRLGFWYEPHCYRHATCRMGRRHLGRQAVGVGLAMGHSRRQAGLEDLRTQRVCVVLQVQRVGEVSHFGLRRQARAPQASGAGGWAGDGALTSTGRSSERAQRISEVSHLEPHRQARAFRRQGLAACLTCSVCRRCVRLEAVVWCPGSIRPFQQTRQMR